MDKIFIYQFTDPTCVWCWGNEPELRAIDYLYGDKVEIRFITGGLIEDISTFYHINADKSQIISKANQLLAEEWVATSAIHGMPVVATNMHLYTEQYPSSFPQNIAYHAAKSINPQKAKDFLRRIREATFTEGQRTSQIDVLIELAIESDIDPVEFIDQFTYGSSQAEFISDRMKCRRHGITGFPSYLIKRADTYIILGGYQRLSSLQSAINRLSRGRCHPRRIGPSLANITEFIKHYKSVYPKEIEVAFNIDNDRASLMINQLRQNKKIHTSPVGSSLRISILHPKQASHAGTGAEPTSTIESNQNNENKKLKSATFKIKEKALT